MRDPSNDDGRDVLYNMTCVYVFVAIRRGAAVPGTSADNSSASDPIRSRRERLEFPWSCSSCTPRGSLDEFSKFA